MSSRLTCDQYGRAVVVVTTPSLWLAVGKQFLVIDMFELGFTPPGRAPTAAERMSARPPYESNSAKRARRERLEVPDDELDEQAALAAAYAEQRRTPPDLIGRVAA
jgi:hypothetical protein